MLRTIAIAIIALLLTACITGCAGMLMGTEVQKAAANFVVDYCKQPAPYRMAYRNEFNQLIAPNSAQINCAADATPPAPATEQK